METEKEILVAKVNRMVGYVPNGFSDTLDILTHPDVIQLTEDFINAVKAKDA